MKSENQDVIYLTGDDEYRTYCNIWDILYIESFYKSHLESGTHSNIIHKKQRIIKAYAKIQIFYFR